MARRRLVTQRNGAAAWELPPSDDVADVRKRRGMVWFLLRSGVWTPPLTSPGIPLGDGLRWRSGSDGGSGQSCGSTEQLALPLGPTGEGS
jgi:hypothetical protein